MKLRRAITLYCTANTASGSASTILFRVFRLATGTLAEARRFGTAALLPATVLRGHFGMFTTMHGPDPPRSPFAIDAARARA